MIRHLCCMLVASICLTHAVTAQAWSFKEFGRQVAIDTARNNCWPKPFLGPDRETVRAPFFLMVENGWRTQNTLGDHHFKGTDGQLTEAGKLKVRWIAEQAPRHHRSIFVLRAGTPEETAARVDTVQELVIARVREGELPPVLETSKGVAGWSAERVDAIGRKFRESSPEPRLPAMQVGGEE